LLRDLSTEQSPDVSTDVLRRVVFGRTTARAAWTALAEEGPLRRYGLIVATSPTDAPEHRQTWKVSSRVLALVHGELSLDPSLGEIATTTPPFMKRLEELEVDTDAARRVDRGMAADGLVIVKGGAGTGRRSLVAALADRRGLRLLEVNARALGRERGVLRDQLRAIARECRLLELVPLVRDFEALGQTDGLDRYEVLLAELPGLVLATTTQHIARRWPRSPMVVELPPLSGRQRRNLWRMAIPSASDDDYERLSTMYPLAPALIHATGEVAVENAASDEMHAGHIALALRSVLDDRMAGLATRLNTTQTWDDLVLPEDQATSLVELLARIRERALVYETWGFGGKLGKGLGVSALFSGPPGTGKSMAAALVARALYTEIYQVDLSKIVSKWIGETEKNLAALFEAAEAGHAILLFDEADSLFGKRTEVKSSNDRYANQEVNFLLQRLESYSGICILTTNHETAIDEAFRRRLSVHVRFPMPEEDERHRLWQVMLPKSAPVEGDLGLDRLAEQFVMSGGYIRNAVLRAAFLAADERGAINAIRLLRAAQLEYEALGKVVGHGR